MSALPEPRTPVLRTSHDALLVRAARKQTMLAMFPPLTRSPPHKEARATLIAIGTDALASLDSIFGDAQADRDVRLHAPRTIGFFPPRAASSVLMRHLDTALDGSLTYRVLRALGSCRAADPSLTLDDGVLARCLDQTLTDTFRLLDQRLALERGAIGDATRATPVHGLLVDLLRHRQARATERLFRLVGLLFPREDARSLYRGIRDPSPKVRDSSRELLEHLLEPALQGAVLALVDDIVDEERLTRADPFYDRPGIGYVGTLSELLERGEYGDVALVATHIGEVGAGELAPSLEGWRTSASPTVGEAVERALAQLGRLEVAPDGP